jgi:hypothetical protein
MSPSDVWLAIWLRLGYHFAGATTRRHATLRDEKCLSYGHFASIPATACDAARHTIMSFAATLAIVAGYQSSLAWSNSGGRASSG